MSELSCTRGLLKTHGGKMRLRDVYARKVTEGVGSDCGRRYKSDPGRLAYFYRMERHDDCTTIDIYRGVVPHVSELARRGTTTVMVGRKP